MPRIHCAHMEADAWLLAIVSALLILGNAFFVASEYALISTRRSRVEALSRKGGQGSRRLLRALDELSHYVAASQVGITMIGIGYGAIAEPFVTRLLGGVFGSVDRRVGYAVAFLVVTFAMLVLGELFPKYLVLRSGER
ncbi:MAG: DUF21 domain-containing protein, partial [Fimbriimonas ginsengisoli]|nr:DUF21 domain-containing protein [Fimbriimonas ginsengisoli]